MLDMNLSSVYTEDIRFLPGRNPHKRGEFFMQKLSGRKLLLIGFTLFSMFFGAGNLIFPPDRGIGVLNKVGMCAVECFHLLSWVFRGANISLFLEIAK